MQLSAAEVETVRRDVAAHLDKYYRVFTELKPDVLAGEVFNISPGWRWAGAAHRRISEERQHLGSISPKWLTDDALSDAQPPTTFHTLARSHGRVFAAPVDVVFSEVDVVEPDLVFVSMARQADVLTAAHIRGAPDLVVEVGSPSTPKRDETIKRRLGERFGVGEFWVVDPELDKIDKVKVYRLVEGRFARTARTHALLLQVGHPVDCQGEGDAACDGAGRDNREPLPVRAHV